MNSLNIHKTKTLYSGIKKLQKNNIIDKKFAENLLMLKDPYLVQEKLKNYYNDYIETIPYINLALKINLKKIKIEQKSDLREEQFFYQNKSFINNNVIEYAKKLSDKDTDPEILKIKKELKKNFNIKQMFFDNNLDTAIDTLNAFKILKENNLELPQQIIISKFIKNSTAINTSKLKTIIINPNLTHSLCWLSTESPMHNIIHECIHINQPDLLIFNFKELPKKYLKIAYKLSDYSYKAPFHEIHAELLTKYLLEELNTEELELLEYIKKQGWS